jgi:hypothetical protein
MSGALVRGAVGAALALAVLSPVLAEETVRTPAAGLSISEYFTCPEPPHRGLLTLEPSGVATLIVTRGFDPRKGRSTIHKKRLSQDEVEEMAALLRGSDYESIPETTFDAIHGRPRRTDACGRSIEITLGGKIKRIRYDHGYDNPPALDAILKGIHAILDRHEWVQDPPVPK